MSREVHVRFCEGLGVKFPRATRPVAMFQYGSDAERFGRALKGRTEKFSLELSPEKTRQLYFGRFARENLAREGKQPETFEFLGFKHVCGVDQKGRFAVVRIPSETSCRKFLDRVRQWLRVHMHWKVRIQQQKLSQMLNGFYQYFGLTHCYPKLSRVHGSVIRQWRTTLRRRSQRSKTHWSYLKRQPWFTLPSPHLPHSAV